jgi:Mrp family chromosome partitioning ATPase
MGNHGGDVTLLEVSDENFIRSRFNELKMKYDIIIIETPPLSSLNKSKEWLLFANKTIAVFEANRDISKWQKDDINYFKNLEGKFAGWVLNKTDPKTGQVLINFGKFACYKPLTLKKMRMKPAESEGDVFKDLTPLEQKTRKASIVLAFVGVFVWVVKIFSSKKHYI